MIEKAFSELPDVRVLLFEPVGTPDAKAMPVRTTRPHMTPARALFIKLMDAYRALEYSRTLLEVQKLAYFLQEAGEPLRLKYEAGHYGPYATNLNKVLEMMEGHFIRDTETARSQTQRLSCCPAPSRRQPVSSLKNLNLWLVWHGGEFDRGFRDTLWYGTSGDNSLVAHRGGPQSAGPAADIRQAVDQITPGIQGNSRCLSRSTFTQPGFI